MRNPCLRSSPLGATSNAWSAPRRCVGVSRAPSAGPTPTPAQGLAGRRDAPGAADTPRRSRAGRRGGVRRHLFHRRPRRDVGLPRRRRAAAPDPRSTSAAASSRRSATAIAACSTHAWTMAACWSPGAASPATPGSRKCSPGSPAKGVQRRGRNETTRRALRKKPLPFTSKVVVDGRLVTGRTRTRPRPRPSRWPPCSAERCVSVLRAPHLEVMAPLADEERSVGQGPQDRRSAGRGRGRTRRRATRRPTPAA